MVKITANLTGIIADTLERDQLVCENSVTVGDLKKEIKDNASEISNCFLNVAVNGELADDSVELSSMDHIIVFHPFSGG
jgi:molybdopterin converting factor small subunit